MSEDDIRTKVVYPWLIGCGFSPADISIEFSFELTIGRGAYRVGVPRRPARRSTDSSFVTRPRTDVLVRHKQTNLMVIEVKAPDEPVDDAARDQGISYARLLPQIAPFVVITNGFRTLLYDSITREEISGGPIPPDHPGLRGGFRFSGDELKWRAEALEAFVSLSADNLLAFCERQLDFRMRRLRDTDPASGKKYIPSLYVDRPDAESRITKLLDQDKARVIAVLGRPQVGKTNFLCRLAEDRIREGQPVLFYPAVSLASGLLWEVAEDFGWLLGDQNPVAILASRLGQLLQRLGSRLVLIIDGWNEAELSVARAIDRECERISSGSPNLQLVVSFTHSAANRLLVHIGDPSFVAGATGIGVRGHEIIVSDPAAAVRQAAWSAVVVEPYNQDEQAAAYRIFGDHYAVREPQSHRRTSDPYLLGVAMRHFARRALPDTMDEPELLGAWLEARIGRVALDGFDARSALTALGRAMLSGGCPLPEAAAKQCWGLSPISQVPSALFESALLASMGTGSGRFIDFYNSRDRDYVIACWSFNWANRLAAGEPLWDEFASAARYRPGADSLMWFFSQPTFLAWVLTHDGSLPAVADGELRRLFLTSVRHLLRRTLDDCAASEESFQGTTCDLRPYHDRWAAQSMEWAMTDPDLRCRVEAMKLLVAVTDEEDDLLAVIPSDASQQEFVRGLLEVHEEFALEANGLGQLVLETFRKIHFEYSSGHEEEHSPLTLILDEESTHPSREIRAAALASIGDLMPRTFLKETANDISGRLVPEDYLGGIQNAVSRLIEFYHGIGYCPSYMSSLKGDYDTIRDHYLHEQKLLAGLSRFMNIRGPKGELEGLLDDLADMLPEDWRAQLSQLPIQDAPGQQYLFDP
jgi:hypothetical protein